MTTYEFFFKQNKKINILNVAKISKKNLKLEPTNRTNQPTNRISLVTRQSCKIFVNMNFLTFTGRFLIQFEMILKQKIFIFYICPLMEITEYNAIFVNKICVNECTYVFVIIF